MNTVRAAQVTKSVSDKSLVELTLRVMSPAPEATGFEVIFLDNEVQA